MVSDLAPNLDECELYDRYEEIREQYRDRVKKVLLGLKEELERFSWYCSRNPYEMDAGEWAILVTRDPCHLGPQGQFDNLDVEIKALIMNSKEWDGTRGGTAFHISVTSYGGEIVGGFAPHNYSEDVWASVEDSLAVEERMKLLEQIDPTSMLNMLRKWIKGRQESH
jgi:hypothetical protein